MLLKLLEHPTGARGLFRLFVSRETAASQHPRMAQTS
jgi:hypothetical protein